jgi:serine/threonine protein kinase
LPVTSAVAAAHRAGVIHRDLKPANVVLARRGLRWPERMQMWLNEVETSPQVSYDETLETLTITGLQLIPDDRLRLSLETDAPSLLSRRDRRLETCRRMLQHFNLDVRARARIDKALPDLLAGRAVLDAFAAPLKDAHLNVLRSVIERKEGQA